MRRPLAAAKGDSHFPFSDPPLLLAVGAGVGRPSPVISTGGRRRPPEVGKSAFTEVALRGVGLDSAAMLVFLLSVLLSFPPALACAGLVYWLDRYEREPKLLVTAAFGWGAMVATVAAIVAQGVLSGVVVGVTGSEQAADVAGTTVFAPVTEETLKGVAVLLIFLIMRRELDSVMDGVLYAGVTALGFAATEDALYLFGAGSEGGVGQLFSLFVLRVVMGIWDHPFYTAFIGIGLALSRLGRTWVVRWLAPPIGWALAVGFHALHNSLATLAEGTPGFGAAMFAVDWGGWAVMAGVVAISIWAESRLLRRQLAAEVGRGTLRSDQVASAVSFFGRTTAGLRALGTGRWRATRRLHQVCGELAHKKEQLARLGEEDDNAAAVRALRAELGQLSASL